MTFDARIQVDKAHYDFKNYVRKDRWTNYWRQLHAVIATEPTNILEVGPGDGIVTKLLQMYGYNVSTLDIDPELSPTYVGSVQKIPVPDASFGTVLCSEVLEHLPYDESLKAIAELVRVAQSYVVIGLPHAGGVFLLKCKLPLLPYVTFFWKLPFFWKKHTFNGEHYWELGKKGYSIARIKKDIMNAGLTIENITIDADDPSHYIFSCKKNEK